MALAFMLLTPWALHWPLAPALSRGFAGDPKGLTKLISDGIEHPGFSVIEIKSPCVTFRPEQKAWQKQMRSLNVSPTSNKIEAAQSIHASDGFDTCIFYQADQPVFRPQTQASQTLADIEQEWAL